MSNPSNGFTINLFGTGLRYWICKIPIDKFSELNKVRLELGESFENLLFDLDFLQQRGFSHWSKIYPTIDERGILISPGNFIEIRKGTKRIRKIELLELTRPVLFQLYDVIHDNREIELDQAFVQLALVQFNKGLIAKYKLDEEKMDLEKFQFNLNFEPLQGNLKMDWLTEIYYKKNILVRQKEDVVVVGSRVVELF